MGKPAPWQMSARQCTEADREFIQFNHRREAWLALRRYDMAIVNADHTLALLDFIKSHGREEDFIASHEQLRGPVIFHRTQALTILALENRRYEDAIDTLREGVESISAHQQGWWEPRDLGESPNPALIDHLRNFEQEIRNNYRVEKTLREQLDDAVAREDYELAARLRDRIKAQTRVGRGQRS